MSASIDHPTGASQIAAARVSGWLLAGATLLMVVFMAMHPTPEAHDLPSLVLSMSRGAAFNSFIHGSLMGILSVVLLAFWLFTDVLGPRSIALRAALLAFAIGTVALLGAATVNGFIVPGIIPARDAEDPELAERLRPLLALCRVANATLSQIGIVAISGAVLLWSLSLLRRQGWLVVSVLGLLASLAPLGALAAGRLPIDFHGFGAFVLVQAIWYIAVAIQLIRGRV